MRFLPTFFDKYFTVRDKETDTNKDGDGKGTLERFNEIVPNDLDENIMPLIDNLLENNIEPATCYERFVPYLESAKGYDEKNRALRLANSLPYRRAVLKHIHKYYNLKGTIRNFQVLFGMMGLGVTVTEVFGATGFDSTVTLDDMFRRFDSSCPTCTDFSLALTGNFSELNQAQQLGVASIIVFNTPINAILRGVTYNGDTVANLTGDFNLDFSIDDFDVLTA